ncbi:hypothetical protein [Marinobacterium weihaiense]|uniref:Uncharacterized protein n=1 Tax=Marinobacterium weihaiense TaxID=2851016 RepID=A0ABS6M6Y6_9GAMM|nr:hypothetical protein [Marinobacterium weihaiense]MBV0932039.1 hypothetical protein [Marinobacterium weihaiense]
MSERTKNGFRYVWTINFLYFAYNFFKVLYAINGPDFSGEFAMAILRFIGGLVIFSPIAFILGLIFYKKKESIQQSNSENPISTNQNEKTEHSKKETPPKTITTSNFESQEKWEVLTEYCPMMSEYHQRLNQLSRGLADRYMAVACQKNYLDKDGRLMKRILSLYLEKHYGKSEEIQNFALNLIRDERHDALDYLKKHIDIVGDQVSPREIIEKIEDKFFQPSDLIDAIKRIMAYNDSFYSCILNENNQTILYLFISKQLSSVGYDVVEKGKQVMIAGKKNRYEFNDRSHFIQEIRGIVDEILE